MSPFRQRTVMKGSLSEMGGGRLRTEPGSAPVAQGTAEPHSPVPAEPGGEYGQGSPALVLPNKPLVTLRPSGGWVRLNVRELWAYRELLYFLAWRDVKVRYK